MLVLVVRPALPYTRAAQIVDGGLELGAVSIHTQAELFQEDQGEDGLRTKTDPMKTRKTDIQGQY